MKLSNSAYLDLWDFLLETRKQLYEECKLCNKYVLVLNAIIFGLKIIIIL